MEQQNIGNNSFTFTINNFRKKQKEVFHGSKLLLRDYSKYNINKPGRNQWLIGDSSLKSNQKKKQNNLVRISDLTDQQKKCEDSLNTVKRKKRKKRKKNNVEDMQQKFFESNAVNGKKYTTNPKSELNTSFRDTNYKKSIACPLGTSNVSMTSHVVNHSNRNSNDIRSTVSSNYNVSYKQKKKRKKLEKQKYDTINKFRGNSNTSESNYSGQFALNGSESKVVNKQDLDLLYFDIYGNGRTSKEQEANKNVVCNGSHINIFNCDTSNNCNDKKTMLQQSENRRKKKKDNVNESNNFNFLFYNINKDSDQICDKNDVLIETGLENNLESEEVAVMSSEDKERFNVLGKESRKRKKRNKNAGTSINILDSEDEVKLNKHILLEDNGTKRTENSFKMQDKLKKKKSRKKSVDLIVNVSDSDCEFIDFDNSISKTKGKHNTYKIDEKDSKPKHKTRIMENNMQENILGFSNANTKNALLKMSEKSSEDNKESDELNVVDDCKFLKVKKKKTKSQADNNIGYTKNMSKFKKDVEDVHDTNISREDVFDCNINSLENKNNSLPVTPDTKACEIVKAAELKTHVNENDGECEIIDFVSSNRKKKKQQFINVELDAIYSPKRKQKVQAKETDVQENTHETTNTSKLLRNINKDDSEYSEMNITDDFKRVKSKKKKHKNYSNSNILNILKKEEIDEEDDVHYQNFRELNDSESTEEEQDSNDKFKYSKQYGFTSKNYMASGGKLFYESPGNKSYTMSQDVQTNTNRRNEQSQIGDNDTLTIISEDECEIIDYVSSNSKKRRKRVTSTKSDVYNTPKKKYNTTIKIVDNNENSATVSRKNNYDASISKGQTGNSASDVEKQKIFKEVNNKQQEHYNKLDTVKSLKEEWCWDDELGNHYSISHKNNEMACVTKDDKSVETKTEIQETSTNSLTSNVKLECYSDKPNIGVFTLRTDLNSPTKTVQKSDEMEIKDDNQDDPSNSKSESTFLEEETNKVDEKVKNIKTPNSSESEHEIIDYVGSSTKKKRKHITGEELEARNTNKKKCKTAKVKNEENVEIRNALNNLQYNENELSGKNPADDYNLVKVEKKKHKFLEIRTDVDYVEKQETIKEEVDNERQENPFELVLVNSLKEEHYQDELEDCNSISLKENDLSSVYETEDDSTHESQKIFNDCQSSDSSENEDSTHGSQEIFSDDRSSDGSEIIGSKWGYAQYNTEVDEDGTNNSTNDALNSYEYHIDKVNIDAITKDSYVSDHIESEEDEDRKKESPDKIKRNEESIRKRQRKSIIPVICTDPEELEDDIEKLRNLIVLFPFSIPPLHALTTRTTTPTKELLEKIRQQNLSIKSGPFSKEEDEKIIENWKQLCREHGLGMNPSLFFKFPTKMKMETKVDILRYLAHDMDDRLVHRVYIRFRHLLQQDHIKTGRFTPEEDEMLLEFLRNTHSGRPFSDLSKLLRRTKTSVERRYNLLTNNDNKVTHWTVEMVDRFVKALMKITKCEKVKKLKHREFTNKEWQKLSKKLDNIPIKKLQRAWKVTIYPRLFSKEVDMREVKEDIINILCDRNETDWRTVNWKEIAKHFKGVTADKIYMMFKQLIHFHVPRHKRSDLKECLDFLNSMLSRYGRLHSTHKFKKFIVKNGHITYNIENSN
ncbi:MATH and LRR domain-containing protein PFE0570w [Anoplophora glabripennis]|uniref:MATH and LRR domain-containing protein PFE0570w n=1 Tax=Anoplophora glabripennis TaxID=217634 RepID=UPI000873AF06|nr:MATH and LRR domain-containing protein PFE0570w [Anoplophora glabripennis]